MTEQRGRPPHAFTIRRVRLVNFHNLVDETVEIQGGGHLFLLGDNGSGKTTVLDAIHLALTGALEVELNAAARVAGGREAGRTLQGIVLRYDTERGVQNAAGAVSYAVLELVDSTEGAVLCAGVGIEATTMEAEVSRWALLCRRSLDELPLVRVEAAGRIPVARDALRAALGKTDVFAKMSEYRRALAERVFGGSALYEEVCRFWSMAKAYREIVARARDFSGLFVRLLPAPDAEVFQDIVSSLAALDELEGLIEQLEQQRAYVAGLAELVGEIGSAREEIARYRTLIALRREAEIQNHERETRDELAAAERELAASRAEVEAKAGAVEQTREALRAASAGDEEQLLDALRQREAELRRINGDLDVELQQAATAAARRADRDLELSRTLESLRELRSKRAAELRTAVDAMRSIDHPLPLTASTAERELAGSANSTPAGFNLPELDEETAREVEALLGSTLAARSAAESLLSHRSEELARRRSELSAIEARTEEAPPISGLTAARAALAQAGVSARPLYELLEPSGSASEADIAALEDLLGDAALASLVAAPSDLTTVRALALPHEGVRVVVRSATDAPVPAWIRELLRGPADVLDIVGTLLAQAPSLGPLAAPDALGDVEHRGLALRTGNGTPRLIGLEIRRRARERRRTAALQSVAEAEHAVRLAEANRESAQRLDEHARELRRALAALRDREVLEARGKLETARRLSEEAVERNEEVRLRVRSLEARRDDVQSAVGALRARVKEAGLEELERRLLELRAAERRAIEGEQQARRRQAAAEQRTVDLRRGLDALAREAGELGASLGERRAALRAALSALGRSEGSFDDKGLDRWVRVTQRGDQFVRLENIEERLREADRREAAGCTEIEGDGSRGVRNLQWAGRFGFSWTPGTLTILDRRGDALAGVLAKVDRDLAEQREVVNERTRELMDQLVMGDLARELQGQVERLYRTVREINELLSELRFGSTRYRFKVAPHASTQELVTLVRKLSVLDEASRAKFREFVDERLEDIRKPERDAEMPELLDYRRWFDYRLSLSSPGQGDTELTRELRALGSGGEQGVPNYLLVLALAKLMFDNAGARVRPLLFDEAFYGIDAGRRDQLLRFATELGLQLVVASPDQDGVTPSATCTTTLFLVRDEHGDVHLAPYHYWNDSRAQQKSLFPERSEEPPAEDAVCAVGTPSSA